MSISPISSLMQQTATTTKSTTAGGMLGMGESDFMTMLMAQLKHQNPMEPMDDKALMGQVTQLNSLRELQSITAKLDSLNKASSAGFAASMIGKEVTTYQEGQAPVTGVVNGMMINGNDYLVTIGDSAYPLSSIVKVTSTEAA